MKKKNGETHHKDFMMRKTGKNGVRTICGRIKVLIYVLAVIFVNTMWWSCGFAAKSGCTHPVMHSKWLAGLR